MNYYIMSSQHALFSGAPYDNGKWVLTGTCPVDFGGETTDLSQSEITIDELVTLIDTMRSEPPTGRLLIIPRWVGKHLYKTHPAFKPAQIPI